MADRNAAAPVSGGRPAVSDIASSDTNSARGGHARREHDHAAQNGGEQRPRQRRRRRTSDGDEPAHSVTEGGKERSAQISKVAERPSVDVAGVHEGNSTGAAAGTQGGASRGAKAGTHVVQCRICKREFTNRGRARQHFRDAHGGKADGEGPGEGEAPAAPQLARVKRAAKGSGDGEGESIANSSARVKLPVKAGDVVSHSVDGGNGAHHVHAKSNVVEEEESAGAGVKLPVIVAHGVSAGASSHGTAEAAEAATAQLKVKILSDMAARLRGANDTTIKKEKPAKPARTSHTCTHCERAFDSARKLRDHAASMAGKKGHPSSAPMEAPTQQRAAQVSGPAHPSSPSPASLSSAVKSLSLKDAPEAAAAVTTVDGARADEEAKLNADGPREDVVTRADAKAVESRMGDVVSLGSGSGDPKAAAANASKGAPAESVAPVPVQRANDTPSTAAQEPNALPSAQEDASVRPVGARDLFAAAVEAESLNRLSFMILEHFRRTHLNLAGVRARWEIALAVRDIVRGISPMFASADVSIFGSSGNGFGTFNCDLDLCLRNVGGASVAPNSRVARREAQREEMRAEKPSEGASAAAETRAEDAVGPDADGADDVGGANGVEEGGDDDGDKDEGEGSREAKTAGKETDRAKQRGKRVAREILSYVHNKLSRMRWGRTRFIRTAKVPIIQFVYPKWRIECDLSLGNENAILNTEICHLCSSLDQRIPAVVLAVKRWTTHMGVNGAAFGWLSSFSYTLMALHYMQRVNPPLVPPTERLSRANVLEYVAAAAANRMTPGELLRGFFLFYGNGHFNFTDDAVCVRLGRRTRKEELPQLPYVKGDPWKIAIEDPADERLNPGAKIASLQRQRQLVGLMSDAARMCVDPSFASFLLPHATSESVRQ